MLDPGRGDVGFELFHASNFAHGEDLRKCEVASGGFYKPAKCSKIRGMKYRIRELRKARNWTLAHLAEKVGTSEGHMSGVETGKREASTPMLEAIAQALGVTVPDLYAAASPQDEKVLEHMRLFMALSPADQETISRLARGLQDS